MASSLLIILLSVMLSMVLDTSAWDHDDRPDKTLHQSEAMGRISHKRIASNVVYSTLYTPDCGFHIDDGKLTNPNCDGVYKIHSLLEMAELGCDLIMSLELSGPCMISNTHCEQFVFGKDICVNNQRATTSIIKQCSQSYLEAFIILLFVYFITIILIFMLVRYKYIRSYFRIRKYKIYALSGGAFTFNMDLKQVPVEKSAKFSNKKIIYIDTSFDSNKENSSDTPAPVIKIRTLKFSPYRLLKTIFFINAWAYQSLAATVNPNVMKYEYNIDVNSNQIIHLTNGSMMINEVGVIAPLVYDYSSRSYDFEMRSDWYCKSTTCDERGSCSEMSESPRIVSLILEKWESWPNKEVIVSRMCRFTPGSCGFSSSCWRWDLVLILPPHDEYEVYSIGNQSPVVNVSFTDNSPCEIFDVTNGKPVNTHLNTIIKDINGSHYYCPFESNRLFPVKSKLGDLQIINSSSYNFDFSIFKCSANWRYGPTCSEPKSFFPDGLRLCTKLPASISDMDFSIDKGFLSIRRSDSFQAKIKCSESIQFNMNSDNCGIPIITTWGIEGSSSPNMLVIKMTENRYNTISKYTLPCSGRVVQIHCDGRSHSFEMPSIRECPELLRAGESHIVSIEDINTEYNDVYRKTSFVSPKTKASVLDALMSFTGITSSISTISIIAMMLVGLRLFR